jgi:hypothetical protein
MTDGELHEMLDRLTAGQAAAIRAVMAEFISPAARANDAHNGTARALPFMGVVKGPTDLATRSDEIIRARFGVA